MDFINWFDKHLLIARYDVLDYYEIDDATLLKLRLVLPNGSVVFTKEYIDESSRKYAFHWQRSDETWLIRWDNVPHFPKLTSFPHHKHDYQSGLEIITDSYDITLAEVLIYIQKQLQSQP